MPPKRQRARTEESSDSEEESRSGSGTATKRELPTLVGRENYDTWWEKVNDFFYQKGKKWDAMLTQAMERDATEEEDPDPAEDDTKHRRAAWGALKSSLSDQEAKKYRAVAKGRVESLIRSIRANHQKKSEAALDALTNKVISLALSDYTDLEAYIAESNIIFADLEHQGESLTDGRKIFYLLKGLPADYEQAKSTLRQPNAKYTYQEVTTYLVSWIETRPNCPGYSLTDEKKRRRGKNNERVLYAREGGDNNDTVQLCRNFQKSGKCKHGDRCRFRHEARPNDSEKSREKRIRRCYECGSEDHLIAECPKKKKQQSPRRSKRVLKAFTAFLDNYKSGVGEYDRDRSDASDSDSPPPKKRVKKGTSKKSKTKSKRHRDNFTFASYVPERVYKAAQSSGAAMKTITVIDGGSTCSITTSFEDCKDIEPCSEHIMVGGKKGSNTRKKILVRVIKAHFMMVMMMDMICLLYTSPSPRDKRQSRMPSSA